MEVKLFCLTKFTQISSSRNKLNFCQINVNGLTFQNLAGSFSKAKVCLSRKNLLGSKRIRPVTCILHLYITHLYMYMGYAKGANGQCALFKMRFLLHFTCTQFSSTLLNVFGPVVQCTTSVVECRGRAA